MASPRSVIVIGSGLAGLSAASTLLSHNIHTIVLERSPKPGGNSIKASSGINGSPTPYQSSVIQDDTTFYADTAKSAGSVLSNSPYLERKWRESLITTLVEESSTAISWLINQGVDLSHVTQLGGHSAPRTHRGNDGTGYAIISTLLKSLQKHSNFTLLLSSRVSEILQDSHNQVIGVKYASAELDGEGTEEIEAEKTLFGSVIVASGGFAGDSLGLLARYRPDLAGLPSTNDTRPGSQDLLTAVGAALVDMQFVQVHPTAFVDPKEPESKHKFLGAEMLRGEGGVLLRERDGMRFVNEMLTRKMVTKAIMDDDEHMVGDLRVWDVDLVMDEGSYNFAKSHVDFYMSRGLMHRGEVSELGPGAVESLQAYADGAASKSRDPFGRTSFGHWNLQHVTPKSVIYVGKVTPAIHFTMGGVAINSSSEVLNEIGVPIKGLWAAGEITGGMHGENRLGGNALLEIVVFGRIAGEGAAQVL